MTAAAERMHERWSAIYNDKATIPHRLNNQDTSVKHNGDCYSASNAAWRVVLHSQSGFQGLFHLELNMQGFPLVFVKNGKFLGAHFWVI